MKTKYLILLFMMTCFFAACSFAFAGKVLVIDGTIERVTEDSIVVQGNTYNITGIPIVNASGENLRKSDLKTGSRVRIFFEDKNIASILIQEYMME